MTFIFLVYISKTQWSFALAHSFSHKVTHLVYVLTLWKKISFLSLSASKHTILKKIGQHHFLHITSYTPILNMHASGRSFVSLPILHKDFVLALEYRECPEFPH